MPNIRLPQLPWHSPRELELPLPDDWQVEVCHMAGFDRPALKPEEIRASISNPIGLPPIRELARGRREVVILFDDLTRVTRVAKLLPFVLQELAEAGISDEQVRLVAALGCHGAMNRLDLAKKLGQSILTRFPVYNHNPFDNCVYVGTTRMGTKLFINQEVMSCDLKIGIGSIVPHPVTGFGGGGEDNPARGFIHRDHRGLPPSRGPGEGGISGQFRHRNGEVRPQSSTPGGGGSC